MDLALMVAAIQQRNRVVSIHASDEATKDRLDPDDIWDSIVVHGEIIEDYPDAQRGACCLILSIIGLRPIHTVVAYPVGQGLAFMITVYRPDERPHEWTQDYRVRL